MFFESIFINFIFYYYGVDMCVGIYWYLIVHAMRTISGVSPEVFLYVLASLHDCFKCLFPLAKFPNIDVCTKGEHFKDFWVHVMASPSRRTRVIQQLS